MPRTLYSLIAFASVDTLWALTLAPSDITPILVALGALVTAIGTAVAAIMTARKTTAKIEEVSAKADVIVGHVNSAATAADKKIDALQHELALMRDVLAEKKETAALLAQAVATRPAEEPAAVEGDSPTKSLKQIDQNTAETAKNTAKTDATVQKLKKKQ